MTERCEDCGSTSGVRAFGFDNTPLCPRCYAEAELNMTAAEAAARLATGEDRAAATPHACPICQGRGTVRGDFYAFQPLGYLLQPITCRTCYGAGIVWRGGR